MLGSANVNANLTIGNDSKPSANFERIQQAQKQLPRTNLDFSVTSSLEKTSDVAGQLVIELSGGLTGIWDFFPYQNDPVEISGETEIKSSPPGAVRLRKTIKKTEGQWPNKIRGVLVQEQDGKPIAGYEVSLEPSLSTTSGPATTPGGIAVEKKIGRAHV